MPELSVDPGRSGDEAVGFDRAKDRSGLGIDLVDLPRAIGAVVVGVGLFLIARAVGLLGYDLTHVF